MKFTLCLTVLAALAARGRAGPASLPSPFAADEKSERESADSNEVGPAENWTLLQRMTKANSNSEEDRVLAKELDQWVRVVKSRWAMTTTAAAAEDETTTATEPDAAATAATEPDAAASSDLTNFTWRYVWRDRSDAPSERQETPAGDGGSVSGDDGGNFEDIVKKISTDLKKLYGKIKQVMTVVKNWINAARGHRSGFDEPYPMTAAEASASESDGVFVIADPTLIGDVDKSNKYTVPIHAD